MHAWLHATGDRHAQRPDVSIPAPSPRAGSAACPPLGQRVECVSGIALGDAGRRPARHRADAGRFVRLRPARRRPDQRPRRLALPAAADLRAGRGPLIRPRPAYWTGPFKASGNGSATTSMPSSRSASASSLRGAAADAALLDFAVVDAARLLGEAVADVLGRVHDLAHDIQPLRLQRHLHSLSPARPRGRHGGRRSGAARSAGG